MMFSSKPKISDIEAGNFRKIANAIVKNTWEEGVENAVGHQMANDFIDEMIESLQKSQVCYAPYQRLKNLLSTYNATLHAEENSPRESLVMEATYAMPSVSWRTRSSTMAIIEKAITPTWC